MVASDGSCSMHCDCDRELYRDERRTHETIMALAIFSLSTVAWGQYTPPAGAAYIYSGGVWTGAPSTGTLGALSYTPPAIALYCLNGSGQWVPADALCFCRPAGPTGPAGPAGTLENNSGYNGTVGATTPSTGAFTDVTAGTVAVGTPLAASSTAPTLTSSSLPPVPYTMPPLDGLYFPCLTTANLDGGAAGNPGFANAASGCGVVAAAAGTSATATITFPHVVDITKPFRIVAENQMGETGGTYGTKVFGFTNGVGEAAV